MAYQTNFDAKAVLHATELVVTGSSDGIDGGRLVSRSVAILQGDAFAAGLAGVSLGKWSGSLPLGDAAFEPSRCTAIGTEVYLLGSAANPGALGTTLTETWVQEIEIERA